MHIDVYARYTYTHIYTSAHSCIHVHPECTHACAQHSLHVHMHIHSTCAYTHRCIHPSEHMHTHTHIPCMYKINIEMAHYTHTNIA